jgi:hypothetical protein
MAMYVWVLHKRLEQTVFGMKVVAVCVSKFPTLRGTL